MQLIQFFISTMLLALVVTFVILLLTKSGMRDFLRDKFAAHKDLELIAEAIDCDFCFGFWLSLAFSMCLLFITKDATWIMCPFLTSPIIRALL